MRPLSSLAPVLRRIAPDSEAWIGLVRATVLLALIPALWFGVIPLTHPTVNQSIVVFGGYVILLAVGPRWFPPLRSPDLIIACDILVITLLVLMSGGLNSPFLYLYYLTILEAAARINLRQAIAASLAMAGMIIFLWAQSGKIAALETTGFHVGAVIAGGFFLALFLSALVQEYRTAQERLLWADKLDRRLSEATSQLEQQLHELQFFNDLASRLSGELRVDGVLTVLLQGFLATADLKKGVAYTLDENEAPQIAATAGLDWANSSIETDDISFPLLPVGASGGEVLIHSVSGADGRPGAPVAYVPLMRAGVLRAWLCGMGDVPASFPDPVQRRLRSLAAQGVSALEAARLHEEVQRMVRVDPGRSLYPWDALPKLVAEEVRRSTELLLVFSIAEIRVEDFGGAVGGPEDESDLVLRRLVKLLQASLRRVDIISHDGAGCFALMLLRVPKMQAVEMLKRVTQKLEEDAVAARLLEVNRLTLSAAVVTFPEDGVNADDLSNKLRDLISLGPSTPARVHVRA